MLVLKPSLKRLLPVLVLSGGLIASLPLLTWAGGNPGLTIFSGVEREDILNYYLQFGGNPEQMDRYKLYIPAKKLPQGASSIFISYPDYFDGDFDTDKIEVRVKGKALPLKEVYWDKESRFVEINLEQPLAPNTKAEVVMSNVRNPGLGTYYFVCDVLASGDIPVRLYVGTWIVSIER
ncbi:conserved hypothetical protein [Gloeothece citriformis PCC 7424]|uniref:DUF2808 domain-containing protein n=1 Tax=Gloeothece citriformis (strain PCC 7424) TaxID=65393 RepID=B7K879_GLOC7|nr:DUF2808 domain-containing protein [Gloeothece citriformis]ACK69839.1 conserved hypothetical protein [Gloeothece citriformis PCC 7424]